MRLLVDLQSLQGLARDRGLGRYSLELAAAVARDERVTETGILLNGGVTTDRLQRARDLVRTRIPSAVIHVFDAPWPWAATPGPFDVRAHTHAEYVRNAFIQDIDPDAVLIGSLFERPQTSVISAPPGRRPLTVAVGYDMLQFTDPSSAVPIDERPALDHRLESLRRVDLILAISDHTGREIQALLGEDGPPVSTIWGGPSQLPPPPLAAERRGVICAGGDSLRKNEAATIRAFALLPPEVRHGNPLTVVGRVANEVPPDVPARPRSVTRPDRGGDPHPRQARARCRAAGNW